MECREAMEMPSMGPLSPLTRDPGGYITRGDVLPPGVGGCYAVPRKDFMLRVGLIDIRFGIWPSDVVRLRD
jgi:hypothetical protein